MLYFGGLDVLDGERLARHVVPLRSGIAIFWFPLTSIASFWSQFQLGLAASERVFALIDAEPRVVQTDGSRCRRLEGRIEFRDVDFGYNDAHTGADQGFNLTIPPGRPSRWSAIPARASRPWRKLIARFYEFQGGQLLIDGRDIRCFDLGDYRRHLGIVPQMPFLFSGTVAENIRYARPEATR